MQTILLSHNTATTADVHLGFFISILSMNTYRMHSSKRTFLESSQNKVWPAVFLNYYFQWIIMLSFSSAMHENVDLTFHSDRDPSLTLVTFISKLLTGRYQTTKSLQLLGEYGYQSAQQWMKMCNWPSALTLTSDRPQFKLTEERQFSVSFTTRCPQRRQNLLIPDPEHSH